MQTVNSFLSFGAFRTRVQGAFARAFAINPDETLTSQNNLLGIASTWHGERAHWTAAQHEETGLDDLAPYFLTREQADAGKARLEARKVKTIAVALPDGIWTLVPIEFLFGERSTAEAAAAAEARRRGRRMTVIGQDGGFVLVPERFTGEAA